MDFDLSFDRAQKHPHDAMLAIIMSLFKFQIHISTQFCRFTVVVFAASPKLGFCFSVLKSSDVKRFRKYTI